MKILIDSEYYYNKYKQINFINELSNSMISEDILEDNSKNENDKTYNILNTSFEEKEKENKSNSQLDIYKDYKEDTKKETEKDNTKENNNIKMKIEQKSNIYPSKNILT